MVWLVFNLDRALALGAKGAGPKGTKVSDFTFIIDLAHTSMDPPIKTVRGCMDVSSRDEEPVGGGIGWAGLGEGGLSVS
jgi:hypothetical protein